MPTYVFVEAIKQYVEYEVNAETLEQAREKFHDSDLDSEVGHYLDFIDSDLVEITEKGTGKVLWSRDGVLQT